MEKTGTTISYMEIESLHSLVRDKAKELFNDKSYIKDYRINDIKDMRTGKLKGWAVTAAFSPLHEYAGPSFSKLASLFHTKKWTLKVEKCCLSLKIYVYFDTARRMANP